MEKLVIIKTLKQLEDLRLHLENHPDAFTAYDTETTGVNKGAQIIGFSIAIDVDVGYYVVLSYWDTKTKTLINLETLKGAKAFIRTLIGRQLICQNAPFDCAKTFENFGIELMPYVHTDTLILGHLLNENRSNGLKERGVELYGEDARAEQAAMKESVARNGGVLTKACYELYKADVDLIAHYGAKDAILTLKVFYNDVPILYEEGLDQFFYEDESMPLLRGPTYDMNTTGLKVDPVKLQTLKAELEAECAEGIAFINDEVREHVKKKYPGTGKTNHFNVGATQQLAWLLFIELENDFNTLTKGGKEVCKALELPIPYAIGAKNDFIQMCRERKGYIYKPAGINKKTGKPTRPGKIGDPWQYLACGRETLAKLANKYKWVERLLAYKKSLKILNTYVEGIQTKMTYNIIRPSFLQHGTTSGRYSSKTPNFQNLPKDDKRVKACIVSRPGKVFVGADYDQLEPRVFASVSKDKSLLDCFKRGDDFYSVVGAPIFKKRGLSLKKDDPNSFAKKFPALRDLSKKVPLAATYGTTAFKMGPMLGKTTEEAQTIIDTYFENFPGVYTFMIASHEQAKTTGKVYSLYGRPRRIPDAMQIPQLFGNAEHAKLDYVWRSLLNLSVNHRVQSSGASIMNRAAIACWNEINARGWTEVKIILQVHDELILEGPEHLEDEMKEVLKTAMENTTILPGVDLTAKPASARNLSDLK
jgi:DNA polymerase I-like protein with 3'-5' exonuclease and polymerase domains